MRLKKHEKLLLFLLGFEAVGFLGVYAFIRYWSIEAKLFLFLEKVFNFSFISFTLALIQFSLAIYDIKYAKTIVKREYYVLNFLVILISTFYGSILAFETPRYMEYHKVTWKKYLNYPIFINLQKELHCCGYETPHDNIGTRCEQEEEFGCLTKILKKYRGSIENIGFTLLLLDLAAVGSLLVITFFNSTTPAALKENPVVEQKEEQLHF